MRKKIILLFCAAITIGLLGASSFWLKDEANPNSSSALKKENTMVPKEITVTLDKNGFSPKEVTINKGVAVRWRNKSGKQQTVNSDNYPTNQLHKELNFGVFNNESSVIYIFTKEGTYGYHNQLNPDQKGTIVVKQ